jgi:hypothetical protein
MFASFLYIFIPLLLGPTRNKDRRSGQKGQPEFAKNISFLKNTKKNIVFNFFLETLIGVVMGFD